MRIVVIHKHYILIIICYECNYYLLGTIVKDNHNNVMLYEHNRWVQILLLFSRSGIHLCVCTDSGCSFICFCVIILNHC